MKVKTEILLTVYKAQILENETTMEAMKAENSRRISFDEAQAYTANDFFSVGLQLSKIASELVKLAFEETKS